MWCSMFYPAVLAVMVMAWMACCLGKATLFFYLELQLVIVRPSTIHVVFVE